MNKLKIGIIGISEGNGHPYSWSAIFNGYDPDEMNNCGFPVIPQYLSARKYPEDFLGEMGVVTHVWTQDRTVSERIAKASKISNIVEKTEDMIGAVDAVLLARDDAENHYKMAEPYLKAGIPVYIDKPFALSVKEATKMLTKQVFAEQIFTCSSLRYAKELMLNSKELSELEQVHFVEATVMNHWSTYGIHMLEPIVAQLPNRGKLLSVTPFCTNGIQQVIVKWESCLASLKTTACVPSALDITFYGNKSSFKKTFSDSFSCFRTTLSTFIDQAVTRRQFIPRHETLEIVDIIEKGIC